MDFNYIESFYYTWKIFVTSVFCVCWYFVWINPYIMACVVPSRFAKLKIVEDDFVAAKAKELKLQARKEALLKERARELPLADKKTRAVKPVKAEATGQAQRAPPGPGGAEGWQVKKRRRAGPAAAQWEEWKRRDSLLLEGNFEDDMHQALLLSKMEFDAQKKAGKVKKEQPEAGQAAKVAKQKKPAPRVPSPTPSPPPTPQPAVQKPVTEVTPEPAAVAAGGDTEAADISLRAALQEAHILSAALRVQVDTLSAELLKVKTRNRKLCNIIGQGEMKDKAQVLVETENLREVQAELTAEVAALHTALQQERSRCTCGNRQDKKKRPPSDREN